MDRPSKCRVPDVDHVQGDPYSTSWMRSRACPALVRCIGGICSCGRAASTSGPERIWSTACGCVASAIAIRFVPDAWAETAGPTSGISLLRQRARWDRDALRVRFMMYGELSFFHPLRALVRTRFRGWTSLSSILFPTLSLPFYLAYIVLLFGADAALFLCGDLSAAALDLDLQHGARVCHVQSINRSVWSWGRADLSLLPGRLSEMRAVLFLLLGNHLRYVAAR